MTLREMMCVHCLSTKRSGRGTMKPKGSIGTTGQIRYRCSKRGCGRTLTTQGKHRDPGTWVVRATKIPANAVES